ncbi:MAG: cbb3-type cytochrome c oxidase subunit I [Conexibacter sp.]
MSAAATSERPAEIPRDSGLSAWLCDTRGEATGTRFLVTAFGFFLLAGVAALLLRIQLAVPDNGFLTPEAFDQLFSLHGGTMLLIFAVPAMAGIALRFVPAAIGAREIALPRLAAFAYWTFALGALGLWVGLLFGQAPDSGWFSYVPLASPRYQPGQHTDVYAATVILVEVATVCAAISIVTTILTRRARGMGLFLMPLIAWAVLTAGLMVLLAMPPVIVAATLLTFDSKLGTHFFSTATGGDPLLWQHLFWFFGHPLVYVMLLPGLGIVSSITPSFSRHAMVGYPFVAASYVSIGVISFMVWGHHMFATQTADAGLAAFSIASMAVAVPSGIHVFAVLATLWRGRVRFDVPLLFVLGFVAIFVMGGITGVMVGSISADWQYTDTYFVVAHFHYVLFGGVVLTLFGGLHYWYPRATGWMPGRALGTAAFALIFTGINLAFLPMHVAGLRGMRRRVWTYPQDLGWDWLNMVETIGAFVLALGVLLFVANLVWSWGRVPAPKSPWRSGTLEWADEPPPVVRSRYPEWEQAEEVERGTRVGASSSPSPFPLLAAGGLATAILGTIFDPLFLGVGLLLCFLAAVEWTRAPAEPDAAAGSERALPVAHSPLLWGTACGLFALFVGLSALLSSWWYLAAHNDQWPLPPVYAPSWWWGAAATLLLAAAALLATRSSARSVALAAGAAFAFAAVTAVGLLDFDWTQAQNASASAIWTILGSFGLCVLVLAGIAAVAALRLRSAGRAGAAIVGRDGLRALALYAVFLAASWPLVLLTVWIGPRL